MSSQSDPNTFSIRIVSMDYYMKPPIPDIDICYSTFQGGAVAEVPVIRIYGSTLAGQKTCLHVHRALPYLYVPCSDVSIRTPQEGHAYTQLISCAMEKALKLKAFGGSKKQHVHGCSLVRARKFYGFHSSEELFVKIYLYYPHEVARAANLLLGGSVLNRTFQPYESHFPYLLQFLVDYNLYGMGLIHLSKVKFRHPLPVDFIPRAACYSSHCIYNTCNPTCSSASFQEDSTSDACQDPAVWLSSSIPTGWMWPFPAIGPDNSPDQGVPLFRRQSTCELEGDSTVDEILNQQFKMYTSLSQIESGVKMVQSLVPIWEEEYERTGVHDAVKSPDPNKPPPEYVLRTFSHGFGFEDAFLDLCAEAHNSPHQVTPQEEGNNFVKSIRSLTDVSDLYKLEAHAGSSIFHGEPKYQYMERKNDSTLPQGSFPKTGDDVISLERRDGFYGPAPIIEEMLSTETIETSITKGVDSEALGLLRWLASSQAREDIITDDELVHEAILSPLLPTTIEKALERAHLEYESESQQECQDILDSVVGKEEITCFPDQGPSARTSSENMIPQVDSSCGDPFISHRDDASEMETNNDVQRPSLHTPALDPESGLKTQKKNQPLWVSLPFSTRKKVQDDSESAYVSSTEISSNEVKSDIGASTSAGNEVEKRYDGLVINRSSREADFSGLKEGKILSECSLRDLMRRKRCHRAESSEYGSHRVKKVVYTKGQKEEMPSPEHPAFQNVEHAIIHHRTSHVKPSTSDICRTVKEMKPGATTSRLGACFGGFRPRSTSCNTFKYGKLPFQLSTGCSLQANVFSNEHSHSEGGRDGENIGASVESESFAITGIPQLYDEPVGIPDTFNSDQPDTMTCTAVGECCKVESDWSSCKLATSDGYIQKMDLAVTGQVLKFDDDDDNQTVDDGLVKMETIPHSCFTTIPGEDARLVKDNYVDNDDNGVSVAVDGVLQLEDHAKTSASVNADILQIEKHTTEREDTMQTFSSGLDLATVVNKEKYPMEYIELTFTKKPPIDLTDWISIDTSSTPAVYGHGFLEIRDCLDGRPGEGSDGDDLPAFLANDCEEAKESRHISSKSSWGHDHCQEPVLGVPTHYQNDGSFLYLLTPALVPPSLECVHQWILQSSEKSGIDVPIGTPRENLHEALMRPSSPKYSDVLGVNCCTYERSPNEQQNVHGIFSSYPKYAQGSFEDVHDGFLPGPDSGPNAKPDLDKSIHENNGNIRAEFNPRRTDRMPTESQNDRKNAKEKACAENWRELSQISGPGIKSDLTPLSQTGFRDPASVGAGQQLTLLSIEVQAESRGDLRPDPRFDAINIIVLAFQEDDNHVREVYLLLRCNERKSCQRNLDGIFGCKVVSASEEKLLFDHFMKIICSFDPDILMGWEIQGGSLGFLAERAAHLGIGLLRKISRTPFFETKADTNDSTNPEKGILDNALPDALVSDSVVLEDEIIEDEWGRTHASGVHVGGRIVLNIWRIMRSEIKLNMYTVEAVAEAVLRRKVPSFPFRVLTQWFSSGPTRARFQCIEHIIERAKLNLEIINQLDLINRTSELARVFGIDFFSVLARGSQYRVESMFLRLAHSQNYLALSPGSRKVASQPAMECLPLVMEPESGFYADPVVVLDFQSLYPSMIIAYNLCFCTCLGNVASSKANILGVSLYSPDPHVLAHLKDQILLTPNGVMYVPSKVRKGVLPRLLEEILSTRIMVKQAMKKLMPPQRVLHRILDARQLALKLIANVTYGYTAAGFSGRMPCAELADSIVQCGRRTLENAISYVNTYDKWKARVIYGDTDSMFVLLKGRTVAESFKIGQEIASAITAMNPNPVTLKMEKVYHPCVLLTKKRYVGYSYESPDQSIPVFDAKGIETVRRDTCAAVAKTLEQSLRILFEHQETSYVKEYLQRQWTRILCERVSLQDFVFSKEVRLGTYRASSLPPAALVATKAMKADPRAEPRYGERIPYVVIHGEPGARLVDMVVDPLDLLEINSPYRLNDLYYINKQIIPALQRVFGLLGADLNKWFSEMPRPVRPSLAKRNFYDPKSESLLDFDDSRHGISRKASTSRTRIDYYYLSQHCTLCGELVQASTYLCDSCSKKRPVVAAAIVGRTSKLEREIQHLCAICRQCGGGDWIVERGVKCTSLACSIFYERRKVQKELRSVSAVATETGFYPRCQVEWF